MTTAKLIFNSKIKPNDETDFAVESILPSLCKNGQIFSEYVIAKKNLGYDVFVTLPEKTSLKKVNNNKWVNQEYERLVKAGLEKPKVKIICEIDSSRGVCCCSQPQTYILFTHFLDTVTPIMCGDCWLIVPLYRILPIPEDSENSELLTWQADYKACDTLQMHCRTGERFAIAQMEKHESSLSKRGRKICSKIEEYLGKPVYYYLDHISYKNLEAERDRKCPSCSSEWKLAKPLHSIFDYRCVDCRLLSNISWEIR